MIINLRSLEQNKAIVNLLEKCVKTLVVFEKNVLVISAVSE